jgi:Family of unknown function (DUF6279)
MQRYQILLILLAVLIAGCSALRLGYTQADVILGWRANTYFDLDSNQRRDFSARLDRLLAWHRYEQLPEYASFLTTAIGKAEHDLKPEDIAWFADGFRARYRIIVNRGVNDAAEILATLAPEQINALQKQFEKDNRKFTSENELESGTEKRKRARLKKMISQIEDWTGNLTHEQERKIATLLDPIPLIEHLHHRDRMRRQREFVEILKTHHAKPEFATRLHEFLLGWDHGRAPDYAQLSDDVADQRINFFVAVDKLLTHEQRLTMLSRLQKFADDCKTLSAHPAAHAGNEDVQTAILALF